MTTSELQRLARHFLQVEHDSLNRAHSSWAETHAFWYSARSLERPAISQAVSDKLQTFTLSAQSSSQSVLVAVRYSSSFEAIESIFSSSLPPRFGPVFAFGQASRHSDATAAKIRRFMGLRV